MKLEVFGSHLYFVVFGITEPFADVCLRVNDTKNTILCLAQLSHPPGPLAMPVDARRCRDANGVELQEL